MTSILTRAVACSVCAAKPGEPCVRQDGKPASRSHVRRTPIQPCGTFGGYQRHKRERTTPCDACREANRRYASNYRTKNPEVWEQDVAALRARREATKRLIARHRAEFDALLDEVRSA